MKRKINKISYTKENLLEYIKCKEDPIHFIKNYFHVQHPIKGSIKLQLHPYQEELIRGYQVNQYTVVLPARQVGITAVGTAYMLWFNMFYDDKVTLIAVDKHATAKELLGRIRYGYDSLPDWFRSLSKVTTSMKQHLGFENGSSIRAGTINSCLACGTSISLLYVESMAFVKPSQQQEFWTSVIPTLASLHGKCIISSSPNKYNDLFSTLWHGAQEDKNGFHPVHIRWDEPQGRDENFKQSTVECIGEKRWRQEYECEFIN